jgi:ketosteroid isomerase-like protein
MSSVLDSAGPATKWPATIAAATACVITSPRSPPNGRCSTSRTEQVVEQGDTVVWIGRCSWRNRHTGLVATTPKVDIWTFRDGRAVRMFELFDTLAFARAAGLLPQLAAAG